MTSRIATFGLAKGRAKRGLKIMNPAKHKVGHADEFFTITPIISSFGNHSSYFIAIYRTWGRAGQVDYVGMEKLSVPRKIKLNALTNFLYPAVN